MLLSNKVVMPVCLNVMLTLVEHYICVKRAIRVELELNEFLLNIDSHAALILAWF